MTSQSTLNDISLLIGSLLSFNQLQLDPRFTDALDKKDELALVGGLLFEQNSLKIAASCCADFQDWRIAVNAIKAGVSPWMGHNPSPWCDFDDGNIIVWSDEDSLEDSYFITLTQAQFVEQLENAQQELQAFLKKVEVWALQNYQREPRKLVEGLRRYLLVEHA
ncbi:MAG: hypothetical protein AAFO95_03580 [Cyanobacteria bacterium J06600_6]